MCSHRRLTLGPDNDPPWIRLYVQPYAGRWAAMLAADEVPPPDPDTMTGLAFFGATPEEAEREAKAYLGMAEPANRTTGCAESGDGEPRYVGGRDQARSRERRAMRGETLAGIVVGLALLATGCAGGLAGSSADVACPPTVEAPVLYAGDSWTYRFNDGRYWQQMYDAVTEDGLLRGQGPVARAAYYFDQAHTLRKVYIDGTWLTSATPDFPGLGKPELEFPLAVGKRWRSMWHEYDFHQLIQDSRVMGCEQLTVPAGTFLAVRIVVMRRAALSVRADVEQYTLWYGPAVKYWLRGRRGSTTINAPFVDFELETFTIDAGKAAPRDR